MHTRDARAAGEAEERIMMLDAWRESTLYTERERAALGWTDALIKLSETRAPDDVYAALEAQFTEAERVNLTLMVGVINAFNLLGVGFRIRPPTRQKAAA
jgi:alkylhydroperoxidase family enzyme